MKKSSSKKTYHSGTNSWEKADLALVALNRKIYFNMHFFKYWFIVFKLEIIISTRGITTAKLPYSFCEVIDIGTWITNIRYLPAFSRGRKENRRCKTRYHRSPDSNSCSMYVCMKRIHLYAAKTIILSIKISQTIPVNLVSYLSFFHKFFNEESKKKKIQE